MIDLDANATTRIDDRVLSRIVDVMKHCWGNASSDNGLGALSRKEVAQARLQVAELVDASESEIIFTSGATESINIALRGVAAARSRQGGHIITSRIEHKALINTLENMVTDYGVEITALGPDREGRVSAEQIFSALRDDTFMVCLIHGNNEIGTINDIESVGSTLNNHDILFFVDAAQTLGYSPPSVRRCNIDLMSLSAHKMHGPLGIGALYIKRGTKLSPVIYGGGQEKGYAPGTLNVPGIVGMGMAAQIAKKEGTYRSKRVRELRNLLFDILRTAIPDLQLNGHPEERLPGNLSLTIPYVPAEVLQRKLPNLAFSRGSACTSGSGEPSHVLRAIGLDGNELYWTIRIGLSIMNTETEVRTAGEIISRAVIELRG